MAWTACYRFNDAPRYVAMWKLNKLGLLAEFDAIYGLPDPKIPIDKATQQVKVQQEILLKHLSRQDFDFPGKIRTLPDEYEKPGTRGLRTVLMDFEWKTSWTESCGWAITSEKMSV